MVLSCPSCLHLLQMLDCLTDCNKNTPTPQITPPHQCQLNFLSPRPNTDQTLVVRDHPHNRNIPRKIKYKTKSTHTN